jgi:hypothetical protein
MELEQFFHVLWVDATTAQVRMIFDTSYMTPLLVIGVPADFYLTIVHENFEFTSSF